MKKAILILYISFLFTPLAYAQQGATENAQTAYAADLSNKQYNVSVWFPSWDIEESKQSLQNNLDVINNVSFFWYHVNGDGTLSPTKNSEDRALIKLAQDNGIPVVPTISNSFDGNKVSPIFNDPELRAKNIQIIVDKVREFNYDGIDIDYEGLKSEDKEAFTNYIKELRHALNFYGKKLTIAIQAKTYDTLVKFGDRGQDWPALSQYVDEFRIMTYDYGWRGSIPRPVAPYYWVEDVVEYAVDHVPREKIFVGIPYYGYGWSEGGRFSSYTYQTILLILQKYGVDFQYDPRQKTNRLFYISEYDTRDPKVPYQVWFENKVSIQPKLELVRKYDLGGIAIWRLGKEDVENWNRIRTVLKNQPAEYPQFFSDVTAQTKYYYEISRLADLGIVRGQGNTGRFEPLQTVNRAEILKMVLNSFARDTSKYLFEESRAADFINPFLDIIPEAWFFAYVQTGAEMGIVQGYPDGNFKPDQSINRAEALKMALESAGVDVGAPAPGQEWFVPYYNWATNNLLYNLDVRMDEYITRGEAAFIVAKVIEHVEE